MTIAELRDIAEGLRISRLLLILFAGVALVLATTGIYGAMSYAVTQRRQEIGVRLALSASPASIRSLVVARGALWAFPDCFWAALVH
jgi:ABC-type antimicrobial peptide transport system permease subunit